ncbi:MAG TPA: hypothetical protein VEW26_06230 [Allosphingosinicella sp.]|nr:hypothetical protein [Allosphingosinicella sp.]
MIRLAAALLLLATVLGCTRTEDIRIAHVPQDWFNAPMILAINGWEGEPAAAQVNTFSLASGLASKTAVMSGNAEVGLASPVVLLRDPESARKLKLLGCYMRSGSVIGLASRGATVEPPVGYVAGTISEVYLASYMIKAGRGADYFSGRIRKVPLLPPNTVQALKGATDGSPSVNSVAVWEPHLSRAKREAGATIQRDPSVYRVHVCLIANRSAYGTRRAAIDRFAGRVARASAYIGSAPDKARAVVESKVGMPAGALEAIWRDVDFRYVSEPAALQTFLREESEALRRARMLRGAPDTASLL